MNETDVDSTASIPARRIGTLMRAARSQAGLSVRAASRKLRLPRGTLVAWERGDTQPSDEQLARVASLYGVGIEALAPARRGVDIDLETATMRIGDHVEPLPSADPSPDEILEGYLAVLYDLRGAKPTAAVSLRDDDLNALADALGNKPAVIERRLVELMGVTREEAIRIRRIILARRVLTPAAGLVLGAGMIGGFSTIDGPRHDSPGVASAAPTTRAGTSTTAPAPTTVAPASTTPTPAPTTAAPIPAPHVTRRQATPTTPAPTVVVDGPGSSQASVTVDPLPPYQVAPTPAPTGEPTVVVDAPGDGQVSRTDVAPGG